ncbi:MAG TPA: hypothetical protein VMO26_28570 [Vicinamibacterales bacterium]|nr:hypothetical protein [Vicinamibacterales bacterium]
MTPPRQAFTRAEWRRIQQLNTPRKVQLWLNALPYNTEARGGTLRSFRGVLHAGQAHCLEACLAAAVILEQHGHPPVVMSIESQDWLDHVVLLYKVRGKWGAIGRSRDPGLHGRKAAFQSPRAVAMSYVEGYVDYAGRVRGYGVANLDEALPSYDWRFSLKNVWKVEQLLIDWPHRKIRTSTTRYRALKEYYVAYRKAHGSKPWRHYSGRDRWMPLPSEFLEG